MELKTNAEIDREIVAEFVQKNLLTDEQSIYNLVRTDRNLAQRAYDWIRNTATRIFGNKQNRQRARLEHAAKIYAKALKETWGTGTTAGSVRMGSDPAAQTDTFEARTASMDEAYRRGELSEEDYDAAMDAMEQDEEERLASQMGQYSFGGNRNVAKKSKSKYNRKYGKVFLRKMYFRRIMNRKVMRMSLRSVGQGQKKRSRVNVS